MSQFPSQPFELSIASDDSDTQFVPDRSSPGGQSTDTALDAALRSVPLPAGLMTRLSLLAYTVPEDAADRVDWLGC